ncbi:MAG: SPOR domain-containing protein [Bacteroidota bacterium]|nr:SPOR domain-containing protein [Bacteroidota bacterium]
MPNLNIPEEQKRNMRQQPLSPFKRQAMAGGGSKMLPIMVIFSLIILVGVVIYALNQYGYIHLWGEKPTKVIVIPEQQEEITEPATELSPTDTIEEETTQQTKAESVPKIEAPVTKQPVPTPEPAKQPVKKEAEQKVHKETGSGSYSIVVASFREKSNAEKNVKRWTDAGYEAMITEKDKWYRVSVGRYETKQDAMKAAAKLADALEAGYWIEQVK